MRAEPVGELRQGKLRSHELRPDREALDLQLGDHGEERPAGIRQDAEAVQGNRVMALLPMPGDLLEKCDQFVASSVFCLEYITYDRRPQRSPACAADDSATSSPCSSAQAAIDRCFSSAERLAFAGDCELAGRD